ncbi:uncharacterized protein LOC134674218 [Cydia fagiglandana]|uniref:uncharacterized protein LOC134674218 n=1 Tax=Cydia fagiglandana TaxID=1458189 RepID=UPI002FEE57C7
MNQCLRLPPLVSELRALRQRKDELEGHLSSLQESRKHLMQQLEGLMKMLKCLRLPPLVSELRALRQRKDELEGHLSSLQESRKHLMQQLEGLMRMLKVGYVSGSPPLVSELRALRQRKDELEGHLSSLQESREHLMQQLEGLMRMLKTQQSSPRSTPNSSPRSTKSPPLPGSQPQPTAPERETSTRGTVRSAPQTPSLGERERIDMTHSLGGMESMGGDGRNFHQNQRPTTMGIDNRSLRSDLLYAADSVTNAMSTLVRELNSEGSDTEETMKGAVGPRKQRDFEEDDDSDEPMPRPQPPRHYLHDNNVQSMAASVETQS